MSAVWTWTASIPIDGYSQKEHVLMFDFLLDRRCQRAFTAKNIPRDATSTQVLRQKITMEDRTSCVHWPRIINAGFPCLLQQCK